MVTGRLVRRLPGAGRSRCESPVDRTAQARGPVGRLDTAGAVAVLHEAEVVQSLLRDPADAGQQGVDLLGQGACRSLFRGSICCYDWIGTALPRRGCGFGTEDDGASSSSARAIRPASVIWRRDPRDDGAIQPRQSALNTHSEQG